MADNPMHLNSSQEGEIIQLDDDFKTLDDILKEDTQIQTNKGFLEYFKQYKKFIVGLVVLLVIVLVFIGVFLSKDSKPLEITETPIEQPQEVVIQKSEGLITDTENLESLIKKANFLYANGSKQEALDLYGKISNYSEVLSNYNLGVAQMEDGDYAEALKSFQKAIDLNEDRVISALNAAVCALRLNETLKFHYYLQLAQTYLPYSGNLPLYSYLYSLTHFYLGNYLEAFSSLLHRTSPYYTAESDALLAAMYAYFNNNYKAIESLSKNATDAKNWFNLALLYARIGDYPRANALILQSIDAFGDDAEKDFALLLIKMKLPEYTQAARISAKYANDEAALQRNPYPIKITLRDEFFDVEVAQRRFWESFSKDKLNAYKILFYYAPYKVFDAQEAFDVIQEGGISIYIENLQEAKEILVRGQTISRVNRNIANAVLETLNGNIRNANTLLRQAVETYPNHFILHYNLGLNFAQMNDFDLAYRHFVRAFHLNPSDLHAGLFALIAAELTHRDARRLEEDIRKEIINLNGIEQEFIQALLNLIRDGIPYSLESLGNEKHKVAIYYALGFIQGVQLNNQSLLIKSAESLQSTMPYDPIANLLTLLALNYKDDPKALSLKLQQYYQDKTINKDAFYYGASLVREMYIEVAHIIGTLHYVQQDLDMRLITEQKDARGVIQALALAYLYLRDFEKSFTLYNSLIDDFKEQDTQTLFLAAVAAVGAGHLENAAALLQLAKLEAPTHYETRIANAFIALQEKNFNAASIQFGRLGDSKIVSKYFDFKIDTEQLLQNP